MHAEIRTKIREVIIKQTEYKRFLYAAVDDSVRIGFAHDLSQHGISLNLALELLNEDIMYYISKLMHHFKRFAKLNDDQQTALVSLCHFIGWQNVVSNHKLISALEREDFESASRILYLQGYDTLAYMMTPKPCEDIMRSNDNAQPTHPKD